MSESAKLLWTDVLNLVREIAPTEGWAFTTNDLVNAGIEATAAAKWLTKFVDWGYVRRGDFEAGEPGRRPRRIYHILKRGLEKEFSVSDVSRLLGAIQTVRGAEGKEEEAQAMANLFKVADQVVEDREKRFQKKP